MHDQQEHRPGLHVRPVGDGAAPPRPGGGGATCRCPHRHTTMCSSYCVSVAVTSGVSMTWCDAAIPRSSASARSRPQQQAPLGNRSFFSSGSSLQARCAPGAPFYPPGFFFPFPRFGFGPGAVRPGRSSDEGDIPEFPEFRDSARSSLASRSARSSTCD
jgi:hypothetical protein